MKYTIMVKIKVFVTEKSRNSARTKSAQNITL